MAEEPEQVLEQQRIASARKERRTYRMVKHQEGNTDDQCWQGHEQHEDADECRPGEEWHLHPRDTWSTHSEHRGDEVDTTQR